MAVPKDLTLTDYLEIQNVAFEWTDTYDTKDWARLKTIMGPAILLDFRALKGQLEENLTPDQFAAIISDKKVIGDPRLTTQHLLGGGKWSSPGDGTVQVIWQIRVAHQRYAAEDMAKAINYAHAHGVITHIFKKIDGAWKIVGVIPKIFWIEGDLFGTLHPPEQA